MREKRKTLDNKDENLKFKKIAKKQKWQERGITLIALVVTIVILLILSGVTLNIALSDGGLFSKTKEAAKKYQTEAEREALEMSIMSYKLGENKEDESPKLGKKLVDRSLDNSSTWDIIVEKSTNKTYGTGWYYIEKGQEIEGLGTAKNAFVINYETGEIINLVDGQYNHFDYNSTIAVTDGIIFNLDSANVGLDEKSWGDNATLYYYNDETYNTTEKRKQAYEEQKNKNVTEDNTGYDRQISKNISDYIDESTNAFKFNGNNYIEIKSDGEYDFTKGLSFEFYGKILGNVQTVSDSEGFTGLFSFWNGNHDDQCSVRVGIRFDKKNIQYNLAKIGDISKQWGEWIVDEDNMQSPWNQNAPAGDELFDNDVYFVLSFNPNEVRNENDITQKIYMYDGSRENGSLEMTAGWLSKEYYDEFVENVKQLNYLELGRSTISRSGNWSYLKGICYATRIYNKALTDEEIKENFNKTTAFHKYIIDSKK